MANEEVRLSSKDILGKRGCSQNIRSYNENKERSKSTTTSSVDKKYEVWKSSVPILYDCLVNHKLERHSCSCRWGPQLQENNSVYFSGKRDKSVPNTLFLAEFYVDEQVAQPENLCQFEEDWLSPFQKDNKTIVHPGEVTRIRDDPQHTNIVATLGVGPEVFIWNMNTQANCSAVQEAAESRLPKKKKKKEAAESQPDLLLIAADREFAAVQAQSALAMSATESWVLSGGTCQTVALWNICHHTTTLARRESPNPAGSEVDIAPLHSDQTFNGHTSTVKDVQFHPNSTQEFCSVGDDCSLILWDARVGKETAKVKDAHRGAVHSVDWGKHNEDCILTGSADHSVHIFDRRNIQDPVHKFEHKAPVFCVQWCPDKRSVFGSSADRIINIWDSEKAGIVVEDGENAASSGLLFKHCGHRDKVVDFQWNVNDPWTLVSLSNNVETSGSGALQMWRMSKWIHPKEM